MRTPLADDSIRKCLTKSELLSPVIIKEQMSGQMTAQNQYKIQTRDQSHHQHHRDRLPIYLICYFLTCSSVKEYFLKSFFNFNAMPKVFIISNIF